MIPFFSPTDVPGNAGSDMVALMSELYPICRSITGKGVRDTLSVIRKEIPVSVFEVPSGTRAFDWEIPREWNIRDAWIRDISGKKVVDFANSNLHILNYSIPVHKKMSRAELKDHIFTLPAHPDWIPYRTSYYQENWGFCLSENQWNGLPDGEYEVFIDSDLKQGSLTYGEFFIKGKTDEEVLISTHICHPSLCNDNLSGIVLSTWLAKALQEQTPRYSYRFLFIPGTIGSLTWLSRHESQISRIRHGLVITLLGDDSAFTYKRSRRSTAEIDRAVEICLGTSGKQHTVIDFIPYGYDERQYCSPGFNLPVGCLTRKPHGEFPEYHTSADNLQFVKSERLAESLQVLLDIVHIIENNYSFINLYPKGEPLLGKRGLYQKTGGTNDAQKMQLAALWVLNYSDGLHDLIEISRLSGIPFHLIHTATIALLECKLIEFSK